MITRSQEEKLERVRSLIKKYAVHLETVAKLVESGIQFLEEPEMAVFLQVTHRRSEKLGKRRILLVLVNFAVDLYSDHLCR